MAFSLDVNESCTLTSTLPSISDPYVAHHCTQRHARSGLVNAARHGESSTVSVPLYSMQYSTFHFLRGQRQSLVFVLRSAAEMGRVTIWPFTFNHITEVPRDAFASLQYVLVNRNSFAQVASLIIQNCPKLVSFQISYNCFCAITPSLLPASPPLQAEKLTIEQCPMLNEIVLKEWTFVLYNELVLNGENMMGVSL